MAARTLLIYTHALAGGGAERVCAVLAHRFRRFGWRVVLAVDAEDAANLSFIGADTEIRVLGRLHARGVWRLARLLRREKPDVSLSAMGACNLKHTVAAMLSGRQRRAILSFHAFAPSEPQRLSQLAYRLLPVLSRVTARTVAVSNSLRAALVDRCGASPTRTVTLYNPVEVGPDLTSLPPDGRPTLILTAGRLVPDKNMRDIVRAFARVAARRPARLVILGEGPERAAIEAEAARLGLGDRVELPGYVGEPWRLYRQAACFVTASRLESFSMVVAEALAYGLPVVACDSPGPREILQDGRVGALVPPGDEPALAAALDRALDQGREGADARRRRGRDFSVEAGADAYLRLFEAVIGGLDGAG